MIEEITSSSSTSASQSTPWDQRGQGVMDEI
jgi:hypothetical protein